MRGLCKVLLALLITSPALAQDNVLLVIVDDVGVDRVGAYAEHPWPGRTPTIDALAARGVLFRNAWANPKCSPTRATIFTGRYGFRTGIGMATPYFFYGGGLALDEWCLPEALTDLAPFAYRSALAGKWHLGTVLDGPGHAQQQGFELFSGTPANIGNFNHFHKIVDGSFTHVHEYATTDTTDDALRALARFGGAPWFLAVSYNAPHTPLHAPPSELHSFDLVGCPGDTPVPHQKAMIEALDTELGRLLAGIPDDVLRRTHVLFLSDNGTLGTVTTAPFDDEHAKGTLYEGGINVPLIVAGPAVAAPGSECQALVNTTDLFATILELCGVPTTFAPPPGIVLDSVSLTPYLADAGLPSLRAWIYAETFQPNHGPTSGAHCIRGARYKLVADMFHSGAHLFDLEADPFEQRDLLDAPLTAEVQAELAVLRAQLEAVDGP